MKAKRGTLISTISAGVLLSLPAAAAAPQALVSFNFNDGAYPSSSLIADSAGNFYGETYNGGTTSTACPNGCGTVFQLAPPAAGKKAWKETVLFVFDGTHGSGPSGGLVFDNAGNLYGTAYFGGASNLGNVFKLSPPAAGKKLWTQTVLFSFDLGSGFFVYPNGAFPANGVVLDSAGNLYGTTNQGGTTYACPNDQGAGCGTVFELSPPGSGNTNWTETVLVSFDGKIEGPVSGLVADSAGNFYGTSLFSGLSHACHGQPCGAVFEVSPPAAGQTAWTENVIFSFDDTDGLYPAGGLLLDHAGNLYGTTTGGQHTTGTAFELSPPASGQADWTLTTLIDFKLAKGDFPKSNLIADTAGNLYGTTVEGGAVKQCPSYGCGVVFKLSPPANGQTAWTETVLGDLDGADGEGPDTGLIIDSQGNLFGTSPGGGKSTACFGGACGTVFKVKP
jgi:uncharacterized repeat protein (TIGR03803 family)